MFLPGVYTSYNTVFQIIEGVYFNIIAFDKSHVVFLFSHCRRSEQAILNFGK